MNEESTGVATAPTLAELLETKLSVPPARSGSVSRAGLIESARASGCPVVALSAPAGYGKTTLLTQWAREEDRPVAWVSLDRLDDDPSALLTLLASAYTRAVSVDRNLLAGIGGLSALGRGAPRLASALSTSPSPFVLIMDDLHELQSPACHDVLSLLVSSIPRGSQLVAASRAEQPHIPRMRASGDAFELVAGDLALDATGAAQIFSTANVSLTGEAAATVTERTEGWPAGIYLAALIAGDKTGDGLIAGDDRYVADYLYSEALTKVPPDLLCFLRRSAVLDQLCAPLCDAVLDQSGAQSQLRGLEASSLFLVPLDRKREWYRYHGLFREFLLSELRRVEPDIIPKLHLRAADWYESSGSPAMAVEHLLHAHESNRCVRLVTELVLPTFEAGQVSTIHRWLSTLGASAIEDYPPLAVLAGWITLHGGLTAETQRWVAFADSACFDQVPLDGSASFESARAMLRAMVCPAGPEQMLADAEFALAQEPQWSPWRDTALALHAEALLLTGDVDRAATVFREAAAVAVASSNTDARVVSEAELAFLAMDRDQWAEAAEHSGTALAVIEEFRLQDYATCLLAFAAGARLAVHQGDLNEAKRHLAAAMRGRVLATFVMPTIAVRLRLQLAKTHWAISEHSTARHLLHEISDVLIHRPELGTLVREVAALRQLIASTDSVVSGPSPLTPAELRLLPYLQTHLTIREIAERLFVSRNTVNSQVSAIYRKLGVSTRNEAVQHATSVGLLGG